MSPRVELRFPRFLIYEKSLLGKNPVTLASIPPIKFPFRYSTHRCHCSMHAIAPSCVDRVVPCMELHESLKISDTLLFCSGSPVLFNYWSSMEKTSGSAEELLAVFSTKLRWPELPKYISSKHTSEWDHSREQSWPKMVPIWRTFDG